MQHILWRLYHIEEELEQNSTQIDDESAKLPAMRKQVRDDEKGVETARKERDAAEKDIAKQDKAVRRREKDLENQVSASRGSNARMADARSSNRAWTPSTRRWRTRCASASAPRSCARRRSATSTSTAP